MPLPGFLAFAKPKHFKILGVILLVIGVVAAGYFSYKYVDGLNEDIQELSGDLATTQHNLSAAQVMIQSQEDSIEEIGKRVKQVDRLRERLKQQERESKERIENIVNHISNLRSIENIEEFSQVADDTLEKRIRCIEVAAGARQLKEGEDCDG